MSGYAETMWQMDRRITELQAECDKKDATLATYKAAVVEARLALEAMTKPLYSNGAHSDEVLLEIRKRDSLYTKALHTLSALTGDATKTT